MNVWDILQNFRPPTERSEPPAGASVYMREIIEALNAQPRTFNEREAFKLVQEPWKRLKSASGDERTAFVFEALAASGEAKSISLHLALKAVISNLLRAGLQLTSLDAVRLVETVSHRRLSVPYKALLTALEDVNMTPALKDALLGLRPMIDVWHGGRDMKEIHERIDKLVHGARRACGAGVRLDATCLSRNRLVRLNKWRGVVSCCTPDR